MVIGNESNILFWPVLLILGLAASGQYLADSGIS